MSALSKSPRVALRAGIIYSADNGMLICVHCAGMSAKFTGRDISGQKVTPMTARDNTDWMAMFDRPLACESGCTSFGKAAA